MRDTVLERLHGAWIGICTALPAKQEKRFRDGGNGTESRKTTVVSLMVTEGIAEFYMRVTLAPYA